MIRHQNADAMVLASVLMRSIHPLDIRHFEYYQGQGVNASDKRHWLGPWRQHFDDELRYAKITGKTKKSGFCVVSILWYTFSNLLMVK
jgi:hypothetical protein